MANKRQRLAKLRFLQSQQGDATEAQQDAPAFPPKRALKANFKSRKIAKKHPLRVQGKKPGDGCFICKSTDHVAKACPKKIGKERKMICLLCRKMGHTLKNCPSKSIEEQKKCYNCGSSEHRLGECKEPLKNGGTTFALCFLCKKEGHLSKQCPTNAHGIYPKGGCCKVCGGITHLAKDCPEKDKRFTRPHGPEQIKLAISTEVAPTSGNNAKRIVFGSGDDLEDDFVDIAEDKDKSSKAERSKPKPLIPVASFKKVKKPSKVVNFREQKQLL